MTVYSASYFEQMFAVHDDPWSFASRWYERRKRALTLACLPRERYAVGYEPGCANGELSAALASRCDRLVVSDGAERAVMLARARLAAHTHAEVRKIWVPDDWPDEQFDLIVLSEFLFYLDTAALARVAERVLATLTPGGTVLACHWRYPVPSSTVDGDAAHAQLDRLLDLPLLCQVMEPDLRIEVWSGAPSVARQEGFA